MFDAPMMQPTMQRPSLQPTRPSLHDALAARMPSVLASASAHCNQSAMSWSFLSVVDGTALSISAGLSDRRKNTSSTSDDMFAWGSATKVLTASAMMRLVDAGLISLNDTAIEHADPFLRRITANQSNLVTLLGPRMRNVTVGMLLGMKSGLRDYDTPTLRAYQNNHPHLDMGPVRVLIDFANRTDCGHTSCQWQCDPGTCGAYSSTNYVIAGLILAHHASSRPVSWDAYDQRASLPSNLPEAMAFPVRGTCGNYSTATGQVCLPTHQHIAMPLSDTLCVCYFTGLFDHPRLRACWV